MMPERSPSATAGRVAIYRLGFDRLPTPFGDPAADERLGRDLASAISVGPNEALVRYLRARTAFFDRVVVNALEREVQQIVVLGAGYDARCLRYGKDGVRWFEVDRPETQQDKLRRLVHLGLEAPNVAFLSRDLRDQGLADALLSSGYEPDAPSLFVCEGVAVYLRESELEVLLGELRSLATVGTRAALSLLVSGDSARRESFRSAVAALGEPALSSLSTETAGELLAATHWCAVDISERAAGAGFVVTRPVWVPAVIGRRPKTSSKVGHYLEQVFYRAGTEQLAEHLSSTYGIEVAATRQLDVGVFEVDRTDGPSWVARIFPESRSTRAAERDAELLAWLVASGFPAERCAHLEAVSTFEGQAVLVTDFVAGNSPSLTEGTFRLLGDWLGRLHTLPHNAAVAGRPGGAWHHLVFEEGGPRDEIAAAVCLLEDSRPRVRSSRQDLHAKLLDVLQSSEDCDGLPCAVVHPDLVPANVVGSKPGDFVIVDWTGAGWGPRLWSLAWLLWVAGARSTSCVQAVVAGYKAHVQLETEELERLARAMATRPVVLACWDCATGRQSIEEVVDRVQVVPASAGEIAQVASLAFEEPAVSGDS